MGTSETMERSFRSPLRKLLPFFQKSRNRWKARSQQLKQQLKKEQNQVRAVEKSRTAWRDKAEAAIRQVAELQRELTEIKKCRDTATD
jgi:chromosome segregation ATPase